MAQEQLKVGDRYIRRDVPRDVNDVIIPIPDSYPDRRLHYRIEAISEDGKISLGLCMPDGSPVPAEVRNSFSKNLWNTYYMRNVDGYRFYDVYLKSVDQDSSLVYVCI